MDDEVAVGEVDGARDDREQLQAGVERQRVARAPDVDRLAVDELEDEKGPPVGGDAAVEQAGDVGVLERARIWRSCSNGARASRRGSPAR